MCNLSRYLFEQEHMCADVAITANTDTELAREWRQVAAGLQRLRVDHAKVCRKCKEGKDGQGNRH